MNPVIDLRKYHDLLTDLTPLRCQGRVVQVIGLTIEAEGLASRLGEVCYVYPAGGENPVAAEVVGFRADRTLLMPLGEMGGIQPGSPVVASGTPFTIPVGPRLLGRVLDGLGRPLDGKGTLVGEHRSPLASTAPHPLRRRMISEPLATGIRAIDGLLTCGKGQRIGIFAGSGVGKSTLLGMIARHAAADVNVIALIGERGREVREFIETNLGPEGLKRSVVVVSTSDHPPLIRIKGAWTATAIAEYFRDQGLDVIFMMDSVTRFAMAQREVGLAVGEPPAMKAYPPSVFALLPKLMERTGAGEKGTITGFYTVLVESDDMNEPIADAVRSILDGHIVLSRALASENHYPAIDILQSVSRLMPSITTHEHQRAAGRLRETLATYERARDLVNIGAYVAGSNPQIDHALAMLPAIQRFLRQGADEVTSLEQSVAQLLSMFPSDVDAQERSQ
ncbi:MAG: flagellar protein export ATPase FliI [Anaerolineae bacterium]|nr:flagellar protein export ATPase FliI [Anaerolineae bacterium]